MTRYGVWCKVSGGVTGTRESWLKDRGEVKVFAIIAEAEKEAKALDYAMNGPRSRANFEYSAKEMP